jgi:hypothetical protein
MLHGQALVYPYVQLTFLLPHFPSLVYTIVRLNTTVYSLRPRLYENFVLERLLPYIMRCLSTCSPIMLYMRQHAYELPQNDDATTLPHSQQAQLIYP